MTSTVYETMAAREGGNVVRIAVGFVAGLFITLFLFWFMQYMIETADGTLDESDRGALVDFVRVERDETVQRKDRKPEKPPEPDAPPPQPPTPQLDNLDPSAEKIAIQSAPVQTDIDMTGGFSLGVGEGDYLPIVKVQPIYPQRALSRGVQGHCTVQYTVTRQGTVRDPVVLENDCTSSLFHRTSVQAALKFKYKPRVIDGQAVEVPGVRNRFTFKISE
ncbi:MAG: energy transducer TonB [Xanthomonadales bacterium]|jgi:protein TonB|nr:energy transducer TonB [Xanthomonadales bacterium]